MCNEYDVHMSEVSMFCKWIDGTKVMAQQSKED